MGRESIRICKDCGAEMLVYSIHKSYNKYIRIRYCRCKKCNRTAKQVTEIGTEEM